MRASTDWTIATADPRSPRGSEESVPLRFRDRVRLKYGETDLLIFRVGAESFGIEIQAVDEVVEAPVIRSVPEAVPSLLGVFRHRQELLPLYAPALLLGVPASSGGVALVMRSARKRVALDVDDVDDVVHLALAELRDPPHRDFGDEIVAGVSWRDGRLVAVLDARALVGACTTPAGEPA